MKRQQILFVKPKGKIQDGHLPEENTKLSKVDFAHKNVFAQTEREIEEIKKNSEKFEKLIIKTERVLLKIHTVFPFDFFPDTIVIDETKVNIIHRMFFFTAEIISIPIHHIQDVEVDTSVFFATLKILPMGYSVIGYTENWIKVTYLWKNEAKRARRIITGLLTGVRDGIDFSKVETSEFEKKIEKLGKII